MNLRMPECFHPFPESVDNSSHESLHFKDLVGLERRVGLSQSQTGYLIGMR